MKKATEKHATMFSIYAQMLYPFFDWNFDATSGKIGGKGLFTRILLTAGLDENAANCVDYIEDLSNDALLKFFRGAREVSNVMKLSKTAFNRDLFLNFIYDRFENSFEDISDSFRKYGIKFTPNDVPYITLELYCQIYDKNTESPHKDSKVSEKTEKEAELEFAALLKKAIENYMASPEKIGRAHV